MARARRSIAGSVPARPRVPRAARGYALLFVLFAALYRLTESRDYTFDSVSYALQVERFIRTADVSGVFFHPHHILFNLAGLGAYRALRAVGIDVGTLDALQGMNVFLGAAGVALFAWVAGRLCRDRAAGLLAGAGLGLSYGYWTCSTEGRVNIPGVVVLVGVLGAMAVLLDADRVRRRAGYLCWAVVLGVLHVLAVLLHQSHGLLAPAALLALWLSPGRPRRLGIAAYLGVTLGLGVPVYAIAAHLASGNASPPGVIAWALTYAHRGHWWSTDLGRNLLLDAKALLHVFAAQPALAGNAAPPVGEFRALLVGVLAAAGAVLAIAWTVLLRLARVHERDSRARGIRRSRYWFTPRRPAELGAPMGSFSARAARRFRRFTRDVVWEVRGPTVRLHVPTPEATDVEPALSDGVRPPVAMRRLLPVLALWIVAYATFFTFWNPGYFVFWVPVLIPLWLLAAMALALGPGGHRRRPWRWLGALGVLLLLAVNNAVVAIGPHARAETNGRLQKALAVRDSTRVDDVIVIAGTGDYADAEVYIPYFAQREVLPVNTYLRDATSLDAGLGQLRSEMDRALAEGRRVFVHEELLSSEGPYGALHARHGITREQFIAFLHRHYQLERPVRWRPREVRQVSRTPGTAPNPD